MAFHPEQANTGSTWGDRFGFRLWIVCFLLMGLHCLLNLITALWRP
jgi:hypothetical protein